MDRDQLHWGMYQEHVTQARQHENQRERMTALILAVAAAAVAFAGQNGLTLADLLLTLPLIPLGIFGAYFSKKHYERNRMHISIAASYLREIDPEIYEPRNRAEDAHKAKPEHEKMYLQRLHHYWEGVLWAVGFLGGVTTLAVLISISLA